MLQETEHLTLQNFHHEKWVGYRSEDGRATTFARDNFVIRTALATTRSITIAVGDLCIQNLYLPDSTYGNESYFAELQKLPGVYKKLQLQGTRHKLLGMDAQVGVPPNVRNITGQNTGPTPHNATEQWLHRQQRLVSTMQKLGLRLQNTFEADLAPATFWMHGNRNNPGLQYDYIGLSKHLTATVQSLQHPMLQGDHAPLLLATKVDKCLKKTF